MNLVSTADWIRFLKKLYSKVFDTEVFGHAAQVGFFFSFSFFPLLFFLITLLGMVLESTESLQNELYGYIAQIMPRSAYQLVRQTLNEVIEGSTGGKLTIGILITLWSASAGIDSLRSSLNGVYQLVETRWWWHTKLQSLVLTFFFIILLGIVLVGVAAGWDAIEMIMKSIGLDIDSPFLLTLTHWASLIVVLMFVTAVIYSWLPAFKTFRWVWISPGAIVAIILWMILTGGFRIYLQYFNTYNKMYGSLGAVIILMLWMYLTAVAILIGGAINSVLSDLTHEREALEAAEGAEQPNEQ